MKLIFHVGAPKTATTSLQYALKDGRERLVREGISYIPIGKLRNSQFGEALRDETPSLFRKVKRGQVDRFVAEWMKPGTDRLLISEEGYTGYLLHPRMKGAWATQAERTFRILDNFDRYDFRVVLTVRRQDSYLLSCYAHLVRHGRVQLDFDTFWREGWDLGTMSWLDFIAEFRKQYGPDRLVVLPYERIRDDFGSYFRGFVEAACDVPKGRLDDMQPAANELNQALSAPGVDLALIITRHLADELPVHKIKDLIRDVKHVVPPSTNPRFAPDLEPLRAALAERFTEENRRVNAEYLTAPHPGFEF